MTLRVGKLPRQPPGRGPNGRPFCRGCGQEVTGRRQSWCSDECVSEAMIRAFPSSARRAVEHRDNGICAECGADANVAWRVYMRLSRKMAWEAVAFFCGVWGMKRPRQSFWEADHIVPVVEGGGGCGLENYRTLCIPCHQEATRELRRRLGKKRMTGRPQGSRRSAGPQDRPDYPETA